MHYGYILAGRPGHARIAIRVPAKRAHNAFWVLPLVERGLCRGGRRVLLGDSRIPFRGERRVRLRGRVRPQECRRAFFGGGRRIFLWPSDTNVAACDTPLGSGRKTPKDHPVSELGGSLGREILRTKFRCQLDALQLRAQGGEEHDKICVCLPHDQSFDRFEFEEEEWHIGFAAGRKEGASRGIEQRQRRGGISKHDVQFGEAVQIFFRSGSK
ncbi:hypothetical protein FB45DRAFT_867473 [Roridomyces roridus]|uniref:Uncharacterized protein n=1 Tax=Roridomyces roridus TaxID=1738132 RepID=A0AAD7BQV6_9AGAR|nr:hypothetical protein FB45DRAFT_867473 [Roridomyces roridus]